MNEIKCPHCLKSFEVAASSYAQIVAQVRGAELERELHAYFYKKSGGNSFILS